MAHQGNKEAHDEWITLLSTIQNRKITQRGRYLEVSFSEKENWNNRISFQMKLQIQAKKTTDGTQLKILQEETEYLITNQHRIQSTVPCKSQFNITL